MTNSLAHILTKSEKISRKKDVDNYVEMGDFSKKGGVMLFFARKMSKVFAILMSKNR